MVAKSGPTAKPSSPAHPEKAHGGSLFVGSGEKDEAGCLGMKGGNAQAGHKDSDQDQVIAGDDPGQGHTEPCQHDSQRHQPGFGEPVRRVAEQGLDNGRRNVGGKHDARPCGVGKVVAGDQEGQKRRNGPLIDVRDQVRCRNKPNQTMFH